MSTEAKEGSDLRYKFSFELDAWQCGVLMDALSRLQLVSKEIALDHAGEPCAQNYMDHAEEYNRELEEIKSIVASGAERLDGVDIG